MGAFVQVLGDAELFESGDKTAGPAARRQKANEQAIADRPEVQRIVQQVREDLTNHTVFKRFAAPQRIGRVLVSRYAPGMAYGAHYDDAFIGGVRTDLSFTLFLSEPDEYEGGELEIVNSTGSQAIKLPAGCAVVYPSSHLHAVRPVEAGTRLTIVGWVQSRIRSTEHREQYFELGEAIAALEEQLSEAGDDVRASLTRLKMIRNNVLRLWAS